MTAVSRAELALPVEMLEVRPGRTLAVHSRIRPGCKDVVFFFHGSCACLLQWQAQLDFMAGSFSVVACDLYGCGRSSKPRDWAAYDSRALLLDLAAVVRRFASSGLTVLVGHSAAAGFVLTLAGSLQQQVDAGAAGPLHIAGVVAISAVEALPAALGIFRLPLCILERIQWLLSAGFAESALHAETRAARTAAHKVRARLSRCQSESTPVALPITRCLRAARPLPIPGALATVRRRQRVQPDAHVSGVLPPAAASNGGANCRSRLPRLAPLRRIRPNRSTCGIATASGGTGCAPPSLIEARLQLLIACTAARLIACTVADWLPAWMHGHLTDLCG